jgi:ABC-type antimicrobial peptide transport system permease subunit
VASALLQTLLPMIDARNPVVYALVSAVLVAAGLAAVAGPARRAARVDPVRALRAE